MIDPRILSDKHLRKAMGDLSAPCLEQVMDHIDALQERSVRDGEKVAWWIDECYRVTDLLETATEKIAELRGQLRDIYTEAIAGRRRR